MPAREVSGPKASGLICAFFIVSGRRPSGMNNSSENKSRHRLTDEQIPISLEVTHLTANPVIVTVVHTKTRLSRGGDS